MKNKYSVEKLPKDIRFDLADKHRELRKQKGFSQQELAERSGVSLGSLKTLRKPRENLIGIAVEIGGRFRAFVRF